MEVSILSSVIRSRVCVAVVRIVALTCFGFLASTGVALADESPDTAAVQSPGMTSYLGTASTDASTSMAPTDATSTSSTVIGTAFSSHVDPATPAPYRSG
jgi:hypothetical protein